MEYVDHNDAGINRRVRWLKLDPANGSMEMIDVDEHEVPDEFEVKVCGSLLKPEWGNSRPFSLGEKHPSNLS